MTRVQSPGGRSPVSLTAQLLPDYAQSVETRELLQVATEVRPLSNPLVLAHYPAVPPVFPALSGHCL